MAVEIGGAQQKGELSASGGGGIGGQVIFEPGPPPPLKFTGQVNVTIPLVPNPPECEGR
jgi:hypothetical protein